jgi:hypothetical protein
MRLHSTCFSICIFLCMALLTSCHWSSAPGASSAHKMIILGIDGMDPVILTRLMDEGENAAFQAASDRR